MKNDLEKIKKFVGDIDNNLSIIYNDEVFIRDFKKYDKKLYDKFKLYQKETFPNSNINKYTGLIEFHIRNFKINKITKNESDNVIDTEKEFKKFGLNGDSIEFKLIFFEKSLTEVKSIIKSPNFLTNHIKKIMNMLNSMNSIIGSLTMIPGLNGFEIIKEFIDFLILILNKLTKD